MYYQRPPYLIKKAQKNIPEKLSNTVMSFGIIVFYEGIKGKEYLIYKRRDSIYYSNILRGMYTNFNLEFMASHLTNSEKKRVMECSFDELWEDLWLKDFILKKTKEKCKDTFNKNIDRIRNVISSSIVNIDSYWGFPKGKRKPYETEEYCALREFKEEVNIDLHNKLTTDTIIESYEGSDGRIYSTKYFIYTVPKKIYPPKFDSKKKLRKEDRLIISNEVTSVRWITLKNALNQLNPRHINILRVLECW